MRSLIRIIQIKTIMLTIRNRPYSQIVAYIPTQARVATLILQGWGNTSRRTRWQE